MEMGKSKNYLPVSPHPSDKPRKAYSTWLQSGWVDVAEMEPEMEPDTKLVEPGMADVDEVEPPECQFLA
jgi:hypothetical protein